MRSITTGALMFVSLAALVLAEAPALSSTAHKRTAATRTMMPAPGRSIGSPNEGHLEGGAHLEPTPFLRILPGHENRWGLSQLVGMLNRSAERVAHEFDGTVLAVGDLSRRGGGDVVGHHSHESGRDADVAFYVVDAHGKQVALARLVTIDEDGKVVGSPRLRFDDARNWALVEAWLTDPVARVARVFVAEHVRARLLAYARKKRVSAALRTRAANVLFQPKGAKHDDHFHVRIGCPSGQTGTCLEYVTREQRAQHADKARRAAHSRPILAKARKRVGTTGSSAPPLAGIVPAPNDFDDAAADMDEPGADEDEGGEPRIAR